MAARLYAISACCAVIGAGAVTGKRIVRHICSTRLPCRHQKNVTLVYGTVLE